MSFHVAGSGLAAEVAELHKRLDKVESTQTECRNMLKDFKSVINEFYKLFEKYVPDDNQDQH